MVYWTDRKHPDEEIIYKDPDRGVEIVQWFRGDGRLVTQTRQYLPPDFFDALQAIAEQQRSLIGNTQDHVRLAASTPSVLLDQWLVEAGVAYDDKEAREEVERKKLNDPEFAKLRVWKGTF